VFIIATRHVSFLAVSLLVLTTLSRASDNKGLIKGRVTDPLGAIVQGAKVELYRDTALIRSVHTDEAGTFDFPSLASGRYSIRAEAAGFTAQQSSAVYVAAGGAWQLDLTLLIGTVRQEIVVSATGMPIPDAQVGASISVVPREQLENRMDVSRSLQLLPGLEVVQNGQPGGTTSVFIRGGNANASKVLLDGIPINDIGGKFEFAGLATTGIDQVEVLRGPNSVLYGSDALAGVINLSSRRGVTTSPELSLSVDGGNFGTLHQAAALGGVFRRLDYFSEFSRFDTRNSEPNSAFHNGTYAGNFGWAVKPSSEARFTFRRTVTAVGLPNALELFGIPDDSSEKEQDTFLGVTLHNDATPRWHNLLRYGATRLRSQFENPSPTGTPFDPFGFGPNYLGLPVTIRGANGFEATGQGILDFGGSYPELSRTSTSRDFVYVQSNYSFNSHFTGLVGFRFENERGFTDFSGTKTPTERNNVGYVLEAQGSAWSRAYASVGVGIEDNSVFGVAVTPRVSLAYFLFRPDSTGPFNGMKLKFNYGNGIKEPGIFEEGSSLFYLLSHLSNGPQLIAQFGISPIGPEKSHSIDFGVEQTVWSGRGRLSATYFHNQFNDQIEFVGKGALPQLGIPIQIASATPFGATVNSADFRALGAEIECEVNLGHGLIATGAYTYLDAVVQHSFSGSALAPAINPTIPGIPIGAFSPLVGSRPFRRAPHSGSFLLGYSRPKFTISVSGVLVSRRDDSTFLSDGFFGNSLLLPNRNLAGSYQTIDFSGKYRLNSAIALYTNLENVTSRHYAEAFGYPSLPFTARAGVNVTLDSELWKRK
jgi:vitamin B12 transporter